MAKRSIGKYIIGVVALLLVAYAALYRGSRHGCTKDEMGISLALKAELQECIIKRDKIRKVLGGGLSVVVFLREGADTVLRILPGCPSKYTYDTLIQPVGRFNLGKTPVIIYDHIQHAYGRMFYTKATLDTADLPDDHLPYCAVPLVWQYKVKGTHLEKSHSLFVMAGNFVQTQSGYDYKLYVLNYSSDTVHFTRHINGVLHLDRFRQHSMVHNSWSPITVSGTTPKGYSTYTLLPRDEVSFSMNATAAYPVDSVDIGIQYYCNTISDSTAHWYTGKHVRRDKSKNILE